MREAYILSITSHTLILDSVPLVLLTNDCLNRLGRFTGLRHGSVSHRICHGSQFWLGVSRHVVQ